MTSELIDKLTGNLVFSNSFRLTEQVKPEELISFFGHDDFTINDLKNGWKHYSIRNVKLGDTYFVFTFSYDNDLIKSVNFIVSDNFIVTGNWNTYSEKDELEKKDYYETWLTYEIGKKREFSWGTISANYDSKGGGSSICLRYKN